MKNLVSIIVPCYNQAQYLDEALNSVINQTYLDWECIIVNDGSTDNTIEIAQKWVKKDSRFRLLNQENSGLSGARNFGISNSTGEFILPLDADDFIDFTYLSKATEILNSNLEIEILNCDVMQFGAIKGPFYLPNYSFELLLMKNCIIACSFFRRKTFEKTNRYCEEMQVLEDWDLWLSILKTGGKVYKIEEYLYNYRKHLQGSLINSLEDDVSMYHRHLDIIYKNHFELFIMKHGNPILLYKENIELKGFKSRVTSNFFYKVYIFIKVNSVKLYLKRK